VIAKKFYCANFSLKKLISLKLDVKNIIDKSILKIEAISIKVN